ncbi:hypothetical protein BKA70DRAFT_1219104 [Coprinopsis sp. MPI-PUGE-AT-0042]|nr:hypothetical protein BKA70DRAFT_1219104 [Coprinopsis sp. MPI-PUGE-AT-0042]
MGALGSHSLDTNEDGYCNDQSVNDEDWEDDRKNDEDWEDDAGGDPEELEDEWDRRNDEERLEVNVARLQTSHQKNMVTGSWAGEPGAEQVASVDSTKRADHSKADTIISNERDFKKTASNGLSVRAGPDPEAQFQIIVKHMNLVAHKNPRLFPAIAPQTRLYPRASKRMPPQVVPTGRTITPRKTRRILKQNPA